MYFGKQDFAFSNQKLVEFLPQEPTGSELKSLLMEVYSIRTANKSPDSVFKKFLTDPYVQPSPSPVNTMLQFELLVSPLAESFSAVSLSLVGPLGTCSSVGTVHQNKILSANRGDRGTIGLYQYFGFGKCKKKKGHIK